MRLTFDDAVADVVADYTVNGQRSADDVTRRIRLHLTPVFGGRRLSDVAEWDRVDHPPSLAPRSRPATA
jgi:hypothetical protein